MTARRIRKPLPPAAGTLARFRGVALRAQLLAAGVDPDFIDAQLQQLRWRRIGPAIVLHYRGLDSDSQLRIALLGHRGAAVLASFTALQIYGLQGWPSREIHVAAPAGTPVFQHPELPPIVMHERPRDLRTLRRPVEPVAAAVLRAAASASTPRLACAIVVATIRQGLTPCQPVRAELRSSMSHDPPQRHQRAIEAALADMEQGHDALADVDLGVLCGRHGLPRPLSQRRICDRAGRPRFLEAVWQRPNGLPLVVEVDCALHLTAQRWWDEQLNPSHMVALINGVLQIPSAVLRDEPDILLRALSRILSI